MSTIIRGSELVRVPISGETEGLAEQRQLHHCHEVQGLLQGVRRRIRISPLEQAAL